MYVSQPLEWDAALYDAKYNYVYSFGEDLLKILDPKPGQRILDLGCGTGHLTYRISQNGANVLGLDVSKGMIEQARQSYPQVEFSVADATLMTFDREFDAIFSNAVFHWIPDQGSLLQNLYRALKPGGKIVFEMAGKGNLQVSIQAIRDELASAGFNRQAAIKPWYFPSIGEYAARLEAHGFVVTFAVLFDRATEWSGEGISYWAKMFGRQLFEGIPQDEADKILTKVNEKLSPTHFVAGKWISYYKRLRIIAERPKSS